MRIGIFGGAFDPIHNGHLLLADQCRESCQLDEIWFVPTRNPPHKPHDKLSPPRQRVEMLKLATAGIPGFVVSRIELDRDDVSWTVETLRQIHRERSDAELSLIIGGDSLRDLPTWREPDEIAQLATIVAVNRGSRSVHSLPSGISAAVRSRVRFVSIPGVDFSATAIRERVHNGQSIRFMVPRAVEAYIAQNMLYRKATLTEESS
jgi:nicotinate-nucleotide adenylyltransferase